MNSKQIGAKLQSMKGNTYEYAKQLHTVTKVMLDEEKESFTVVTDKNTFVRKYESAESFLRYWYEQKSNLTIEAAANTLPQTQDLSKAEAVISSNGLSDELINILKDNIEKVSKNANYLNQAKAVDKSVDTILKVKKLQLEMYKALNKPK